jgi:hypothetical protein
MQPDLTLPGETRRDAFVRGYVTAATLDLDDAPPRLLSRLSDQARRFYDDNDVVLRAAFEWVAYRPWMAGVDLYMTRNRLKGRGFLFSRIEDAGEMLHDAARRLGPCQVEAYA